MKATITKKFFPALCALACFSLPLAAKTPSNHAGLEPAYQAYRMGDWNNALLFFRQAASVNPSYITDEVAYMTVMSEISAGEYNEAYADCNAFEKKYLSSRYLPFIQYQKGRLLHLLGKNEDSILVLSDFCHKNSDSPVYPSALYWIAEDFYTEYNFDSALAIYERIVKDFPDCEKVPDARYRIEMILQRSREEKLLYLLKVTGEENLAAREDFERELRMKQAEDSMGLRKQLSDAEGEINRLNRENEEKTKAEEEARLAAERELAAEKARAEAAKKASARNIPDPVEKRNPDSLVEKNGSNSSFVVVQPGVKPASASGETDIEVLKRKAKVLQYLLDSNQE